VITFAAQPSVFYGEWAGVNVARPLGVDRQLSLELETKLLGRIRELCLIGSIDADASTRTIELAKQI
jgi:hypothetical protein